MAKKLAHDKLLFTTVVLLVGLGLTMVYSAGAAVARGQERGISTFLIKQSLAAAIGLLCMWTVMYVDYRRMGRRPVVYGVLGGALLLLVAVLFGPEWNGVHRWLFVMGISVQPSELAKLAAVLYVAYQIHRLDGEIDRGELFLPCSLTVGIIIFLILLQPDLGTAALIGVSVLMMLFLAGLPWRYLFAVGLSALPALYVLVARVPYRRARLLAFLDPSHDPLGVGYQANQSLIAVGSGGLFSVGLGKSLQKLHFLPHPHSDFVYSIASEELGMAGALGIILLFLVLLWRGVLAGFRAPDRFGRMLAWGFTGMLTLQAFLHVSVALALVPTKGIPLPFISYGGSSLVVSMTACGVVLNVSQHG